MTEAFYGAGLRKGEGSKPLPISRNRASLVKHFLEVRRVDSSFGFFRGKKTAAEQRQSSSPRRVCEAWVDSHP
jgi:hypothetical protein